jgi:biopolymer transport protein ExbB/TolQ
LEEKMVPTLLQTLCTLAGPEWPVWLLLGLESVAVLAVALATVSARLKARHDHTQYVKFFHWFAAAIHQTGGSALAAAHRHGMTALLASLPRHNPVSTFLCWRVDHLDEVELATVESQLAHLAETAEGASFRVLDFTKVTAPLLGLAGTLIGLRQAFSHASHGQAAVEASLATALGATLAGIGVAIAAFAILRFVVDPALAQLERRLWEAEMHCREGAAETLRRRNAVSMGRGTHNGAAVDTHTTKEDAHGSSSPAPPHATGVTPD